MGSNRQQHALPTIGALTVAVVAVSSSAPLIAYAAAPALAIAFWRNALATAALSPITLGPRRPELRGITRRDLGLCVLAGIALAAHFGTWMPSVQLGSVATATALVATQPVWQGLIAAAQGRRPSAAGWIGIGFAVAGAAWATGADVHVSGRAVLADGLALIGGLAAAVYTALGEQVRSRVSTTTYTWICYGVCAVALLIVCGTARIELFRYGATTWAAIVGIAAGAQLLGHSMFNYSLHRVPATTISVLLLLETPGAALIAWLWLGQAPRATALPGIALLLVGVAIVIIFGFRRGRTAPPVREPDLPPGQGWLPSMGPPDAAEAPPR